MFRVFNEYASLLNLVADVHSLSGRGSTESQTGSRGDFPFASPQLDPPSHKVATTSNSFSEKSALREAVHHRYLYPRSGNESGDLLLFLGNIGAQIQEYLLSRISAKDKSAYDLPVRYHNHVTGAFIGMIRCNLNCKQA